MALKVRWATATGNTGSSTTDITASGAGVVRAAVLFVSSGFTDGAEDLPGILSIGFLNVTGDATAEEQCVCAGAEDAVSTENASVRGNNAASVLLPQWTGGTVFLDSYALFDARITDGIRIEWNGGSPPGDTYRIRALLICGDDANVARDVGGYTSSATQNGTANIALDASFDEEPDLVLFASCNEDLDNLFHDNYQLAFGAGHSTGGGAPTISQFGFGYHILDAAGSRAGRISIYDTRCQNFPNESTVQSTIELTDTAVEEFSLTTRDQAGAHKGMFLALSFKGVTESYAGYWAYPSGTGTKANTAPGFEPQAFLLFGSNTNSTDKNTEGLTGNLNHTFMFGGADEDGNEYSIGNRFRNTSPYSTRGYGNARVSEVILHNGGVANSADWTSMDATGFSVTVVSSAAQAKAFGVIAIEVAPALISGTAAVTLPSVEAVASGTVANPVTGTATDVLPSVQASASGALTIPGSSVLALASIAVAAVGLVANPVSGTSAVALPAVESTATGAESMTGTAFLLLPSVEAAASGTETISGSSAVQLPAVQLAAVGVVANPVTGSADLLLPGVEALAVGSEVFTGSAIILLPAVQAAAAGSSLLEVTGTAAFSLPALVADAVGQESIPGTGADALPSLQATAAGIVANPVSGSAAVILPAVQSAAVGAEEFTGSSTLVLPSVEALATGTSVSGVTGTATLALPALDAATAGEESIPGSAADLLPALEVSAAGTVANPVSGSADVVLASLQADAAGSEEFTGTATLDLPSVQVSSAGAEEFTGSAALTLPAVQSQASGSLSIPGAVEAALPAVQVAATGLVALTVTGTAALELPAVRTTALGSSEQAEGCYEAVARLVRERIGLLVEDAHGVQVEYENEGGATGDEWIALRVEWDRVSLGAVGAVTGPSRAKWHRKEGHVLAEVHVPAGTGDGRAWELADFVVDALRRVTLGDVRFRDPGAATPRREGADWVVAVAIPFDLTLEEAPA